MHISSIQLAIKQPFSRSCRAPASSSDSYGWAAAEVNIAKSSNIVQIVNQTATIDSLLMLQSEGQHARMSHLLTMWTLSAARSLAGAILYQPLQLLSQLPSNCLQSGLTNRRMSEKWAPIKQQTTMTICKHYPRQTCSCCPIFHRRSKWTTLFNPILNLK